MADETKELTIQCADSSIEIRAAGGKGDTKLPSFKMLAYTGGAMRLPFWEHPVILDLAGLKIPSQNRPVRFQHDERAGVGHTTSIKVIDNKLFVEGTISRATPEAAEVLESSKRGFPWQASVGTSVEDVESIRDGASVKVNSKDFKGPVIVVRSATLGEISFVDLGADDKTRVSIAARKIKEKETMSKETATPAKDVAAERSRISEINSLTASYHGEGWAVALRDKAIEVGDSVSAYQSQLLNAIRANRPNIPMTTPGNEQTSPRDVLAAASLVLVGKSDLAERSFGAQACTVAADLQCRSLFDIAQASIRLDNQSVPSGGMDNVIRAAFSTSGLSVAIGSAADKISADSYQATPQTFRSWCAPKTVNNFRDATGIRPYLSSGAFEVVTDGEIKHASLNEETWTVRADQHAKMFSVDRRTIVNDDLGVVFDLIAELGRESIRTLSGDVYALLLSNPSNFFHADNSNLETGANSALAILGLSNAIAAFRSRQDAASRPIDMIPSVMVVPPALEPTARALLRSQELARNVSSVDDLPVGNPWFDAGLSLEIETRISAANGGSDTAFYIFSSPSHVPACVIGYLNGIQHPTIETENAPFNMLGMQMRGYIDWGVSLVDARAAQRNDGI